MSASGKAGQTSAGSLKKRHSSGTLLPPRQKRPYGSHPVQGRGPLNTIQAQGSSQTKPPAGVSAAQSLMTGSCASPSKATLPSPQSAGVSHLSGDVQAATKFWRDHVRDWYPDFRKKTYFVPPLWFNKVPYYVETVAGQLAMIPQVPSAQPAQTPITVAYVNVRPSAPLASQVWPDQQVAAGTLPSVLDSDVREDAALQKVLSHLNQLSHNTQAMMVISQLDFRKYLDTHVDPVTAAAIQLLPKTNTLAPDHRRGDFDVLMISRRYGLIVGEVKAVGMYRNNTQGLDKVIVKRVERTVKQMKKSDLVLKHLVSDQQVPLKVITTLMVPYISSAELTQALNTDHKVAQDLCACIGAINIKQAVQRCLCSDNMSTWWQHAVQDQGEETNMTDDLYEILIARFCGPATTVEVPCVTTPRLSKEMRTTAEAIAHCGLRYAMLTLYPEQVDLLNDPRLEKVYLWGPPGTGKTVVLTLKGMQWRKKGEDVHLMSSHPDSQAATILIENQMRFASNAAGHSRIIRHEYDLENGAEDLEKAVNDLSAAAKNGELYLIVDEAHHSRNLSLTSNTRGRFAEFCTKLAAKVPKLHLWAAAVQVDKIPTCMTERKLTAPLRSPPNVVNKVKQSSFIDDSNVPRYSELPVPVPTEGHQPDQFPHHGEPGHTTPLPEECDRCAAVVVSLIEEKLRVGQTSQGLEYRDVFIVCQNPSSTLPVFKKLDERQVPVQVVTTRDQLAIPDLALARKNEVTVTDCWTVSGLERSVVIVIGLGSGSGYDARLQSFSRCTSYLAYFD